MTQTEVADRVVHEHTELQEYLLQWEAALMRLQDSSATESQGALEHLWRLVPYMDRELPRHFRVEEEEFFPAVEARHPKSAQTLVHFLVEHAEFARQWQTYKHALLYCDAVGKTQAACERGHWLIVRLRQHIREEEDALLPLLEAAGGVNVI